MIYECVDFNIEIIQIFCKIFNSLIIAFREFISILDEYDSVLDTFYELVFGTYIIESLSSTLKTLQLSKKI